MPRTCRVCQNQNRQNIEFEIVRGTPLRRIANQFQIGFGSVQRHSNGCLDGNLQQKKTDNESALANHETNQRIAVQNSFQQAKSQTITEQLAFVRQQTDAILQKAVAAGSKEFQTALQAIARREKQIELQARLEGAFIKEKENPDERTRQKQVAEEIVQKIMERDGCTREAAINRVFEIKPEVAGWLNH